MLLLSLAQGLWQRGAGWAASSESVSVSIAQVCACPGPGSYSSLGEARGTVTLPTLEDLPKLGRASLECTCVRLTAGQALSRGSQFHPVGCRQRTVQAW